MAIRFQLQLDLLGSLFILLNTWSYLEWDGFMIEEGMAAVLCISPES
jgi:hypothetical protein